MTIRRTMTRRTAALLAAGALVVTACAEEESGADDTGATADDSASASSGTDESTGATGSDDGASVEASDEPTSTEPSSDGTVEEAGTTTEASSGDEGGFDAVAVGADYIGGTPGSAAEGEPYRIGFAHSSDFFPEGDVAADAAVAFVNEQLGGVGGRPLELVKCNIATPEDSASCGAEFANDASIDLIVGGLVLQAPADLYSAVAGTAAAIIAAPLDASDYINPNAVAYNTGALGAGIGGAVFTVEDLQPQTVALVVTDDVAGRGGAAVLTPIVEAAGIELKQVFVPPTATAPEIASALQATGAETADVVSIGLFEQGCIAAYDALQSLGLEPEVITTSVCWGNAMQEHLTSVGAPYPFPNWNFSWFGFNPYVDDLEPTIEAYLTAMDEYGGGEVKYSVAGPIVFDAVMSAAQIINTVGVDQATYETLDAAARGFAGPSMIQAGPQECGVAPFITICPSQVGVYQFRDGEWIPRRSGSDGTAIDLTPYTRPGG